MHVRALAVSPRSDLESLYRAHARTVRRFAAALSSSDELDDVVQDVFLVAGQRLNAFRGESDIRTWLYGITRNVVRSRRRGQFRARHKYSEYSAEPKYQAPTPEEFLERKRNLSAVNHALENLDEKYRTALLLHAVHGLSGAEIAARTGVEPSTVWVRLHRARELLKLALLRGATILLLLATGAALAAVATNYLGKDAVPAVTHSAVSKGETQDMNKLLPILALTLAPAVAVATEKEPAPTEPKVEVVYQKTTNISFSEVTVSGEIQRPDGSYMQARNRTKFPLLVKIRADFNPELLRSVDAL